MSGGLSREVDLPEGYIPTGHGLDCVIVEGGRVIGHATIGQIENKCAEISDDLQAKIDKAVAQAENLKAGLGFSA